MNRYMDERLMTERLSREGHRAIVGGLWEVIGPLQRDWLIRRGMTRSDRLLDVGCGSLRGGAHIVPELAPGHYFGIDISPQLIEAGYEGEIRGTLLEPLLPRENLFATADFEAPFGVKFDRALAVSVFTHLTLDVFTRCLTRLAPVVRPGGVFHATLFEGGAKAAQRPSGITTYPDRDPFHFTREQAAEATPDGWRLDWIGDWGHPRDQQMVELTRL